MSFDPDALVEEVAEAAFLTVADPDTPEPETWASLEDDEREGIRELVRAAIHAFTASMSKMGIRIVPAGMIPTPRDEDEAMAMAVAVRTYRQAQKRKGGLVGSVSPGLVLPPHMRKH